MWQTATSLSIASQKYRQELVWRISKKLPSIKSKIIKLFLDWNKIQQIAEKSITIKKFENINIRSLSMIFSEILQEELWDDKFEAIKNLSKSNIFDKNDVSILIKRINENPDKWAAELRKISWLNQKSEYKTFFNLYKKIKMMISEKWYEYILNLYI